MRQTFCRTLLLSALALIGGTFVTAQSSGGAFIPSADYTVTGQWTFSKTPIGLPAGFDTSACTNGWVLYKSSGDPCEAALSYDPATNILSAGTFAPTGPAPALTIVRTGGTRPIVLTQIYPPTLQINNQVFAGVGPAITGFGTSTASFDTDAITLGLPALRYVDVLFFDFVPTLTSLDLPALATVGTFINMSGALTSFSLPALAVVGDFINIASNGTITSIDLSALTTVGTSIRVADTTVLLSIDLSALVITGTSFAVVDNDSLASLDLTAITTAGTFIDINNNTSLIVVDLSALTTTGSYLSLNNNDVLTSLDLSALTTVGTYINIGDSSSLTSIDLSALLSVNGDAYFNGNALTQTAVDTLLVRFAALNGTGGTTSYDNHTINLSGGTNASPSATGLAAKATLEGRGNTVMVN